MPPPHRIYQSQIWDVPLAGGVDEKSDIRYRSAPDAIINCKYTKLGSLGKRPGSDCVTPFANPNARQGGLPNATPGFLASSERGLLRYGRGEVDLVDDDQIDPLRFVGETSWVGLDRFSLGGRAQRDIDVATNASGVWVGFCRAGLYNSADITPFVVGLDPVTLKPNGLETTVTGGGEADRLKLATRGTRLWITHRDNFTTFMARSYDPSTGITALIATLDATMGSNGASDVWPQDPDAIVIWGGTGGIRMAKLVSATTTTYQSLVFATADTVMSVSITRHPGTNAIGIAFWTYSGTTYTLRAGTITDTGAAFTVIGSLNIITTVADTIAIARQVNIVGCTGTTGAFLVFESQDVLWDVPEWVRRPITTVWFTINGNAAPDFLTWEFPDTQLISKARLRDDRGLLGPRAFIWLRSMTDAWSSNLLMGVTAPDNQAAFEAQTAPYHVEAVTGVLERTPAWSFTAASNKQIARDDWPNLPNYTRTFTLAPDNTWITPMLMGGVYIASPVPSGVFPTFEYSLDLSVTQWQVDSENVEFYGNSALAGGTVWVYDGTRVREDGFFTAPPPPKLVAGTGGLLQAGFKYGYQIVYYSESGTGRASYSPVSTQIFVTLSTTQNQVTLTLPVTRVTGLERDVVLEIYRTVKNGSTFFLVDRLTLSPIVSSTTSITYVDTKPDQGIEAAKTIYTTGGVLEFESPPASEFITFAQNRVWVIDDKGRVWFSDNIVDGEDPKFNTSYTIKQFSDEPLNAIAALDEKVILFTPNEIWVTFGDGPDGTGQGGFANLFKAASDVGCTGPRAICTTPWGVFFQSRDGLCLLNRGLEVTRIGKPVEDTTGQTFANPTQLSSAVLVPKFSEVRIGVQDFVGAPDNSRSVAVVLDLFSGAPQKPVWYAYYWSNPFNPVSTVNMDAAIYQDRYTWVDNNGYVFRDSLTHFYDRAAGRTDKWVTMEVESYFANMENSEQSFSRVWRTGFMYNLMDNCDVTISTYIDYDPDTLLQSQTFQAVASQFFKDKRLMLRLKKQRVYSVKSTFKDSPPTGTFSNRGEGWQLAAVSFEGLAEGGLTRLPSTQKR